MRVVASITKFAIVFLIKMPTLDCFVVVIVHVLRVDLVELLLDLVHHHLLINLLLRLRLISSLRLILKFFVSSFFRFAFVFLNIPLEIDHVLRNRLEAHVVKGLHYFY